jgi:chromosome segregation ATPase
VLANAPLAVAGVVGGLAYGARLGFELMRDREERVDAYALGEPWRRFVIDAQSAQGRYRRAVKRSRPGPLKEKLEELGGQIDQAVRECWRVACQGNTLGGAIRQLETDRVEAELAAARRELKSDRSSASLQATVNALEAQLSSAERLAEVWRNSRDRLRVLNAQLDEAVARAVELSVGTSTNAAAVGGVTDQVAGVVSDMEALRQALEETGGPDPAAFGTP